MLWENSTGFFAGARESGGAPLASAMACGYHSTHAPVWQEPKRYRVELRRVGEPAPEAAAYGARGRASSCVDG